MKKKILRNFVLTEISGVDRPAQPTAKMTIMKRADILGDNQQDHKETNMAVVAKTVEELSADIEKMTETVNELTKKLADAEVAKAEVELLAKMSDEEKTYFAKMDDKAKADWAKASEKDKKKTMDDLKKNDETIVVGAETISKSVVGAAQFEVFKRLADAEARIAKAEQAAEIATLEKRAAEEFANLPGTDSEKALLLKALSTVDKSVAEYAESVFKAANEANSFAFQTVGVKKALDENDPETKLEKRAEEIRKADTRLTKEQALVKAYEENPELVAEVK